MSCEPKESYSGGELAAYLEEAIESYYGPIISYTPGTPASVAIDDILHGRVIGNVSQRQDREPFVILGVSFPSKDSARQAAELLCLEFGDCRFMSALQVRSILIYLKNQLILNSRN